MTANSVSAPDGSMTGDNVSSTTGATNTYMIDSASNPGLYDGATVTGSIYIEVPSGTRTVTIAIVDVTSAGNTTIGTLNASASTG